VKKILVFGVLLTTLLIFSGNGFCLEDCFNRNYQRQDWLKTGRWNAIEDMEKSGKDFRILEKRWPTVNLQLTPEEEKARFGTTGLKLAQKAYLARHFDGTTMRMIVFCNIGHASGERKIVGYRMEKNPPMPKEYLDPDFPEDKKEGEDWFMVIHWVTPADTRGTSILVHSYNDKAKDCDTWVWFPSLRKSRRLTPANGGDAVLGSDWAYSDGFLLRITDEVYQIIGETRANSFLPFDFYEDIDLVDKYGPNTKEYIDFRRVMSLPRDAWVVRARSKNGGYGDWYSTRIVLIDKEFGYDSMWEIYDPKGRMMRTYELKWKRQSDYNGKPMLTWASGFCEVLNFEDRGWTYWCAPQTNFGCPVPDSWGSLRELQRTVRSTIIPYMSVLHPKKLAPLEELYTPEMIEWRKKFYPVRVESWPDDATKIIGLDRQ